MSPLLSCVTALFFKALIWNIWVREKPLLNKMINPSDKYAAFSFSAQRWQMHYENKDAKKFTENN